MTFRQTSVCHNDITFVNTFSAATRMNYDALASSLVHIQDICTNRS